MVISWPPVLSRLMTQGYHVYTLRPLSALPRSVGALSAQNARKIQQTVVPYTSSGRIKYAHLTFVSRF